MSKEDQDRQIKVYLDYNVFNNYLDNYQDLKIKGYVYYYSVSHVEEYFKAVSNDVNNEYTVQLCKFKNAVERLCKPNTILRPSFTGICEASESFVSCYNRVKENDTRQVVERNGKELAKVYKQERSRIRTNKQQAIYYSTLSPEDIWEKEELKKKILVFKNHHRQYCNSTYNTLSQCYSEENAFLVAFLSYLSMFNSFELKKGCLADGCSSFFLLQEIIEYLDQCLNECGYYSDREERKIASGIHDVSHIIYSSYCDLFVTKDERLVKRAKAIYAFLGLDTKVVTLSEFCNMLQT